MNRVYTFISFLLLSQVGLSQSWGMAETLDYINKKISVLPWPSNGSCSEKLTIENGNLVLKSTISSYNSKTINTATIPINKIQKAEFVESNQKDGTDYIYVYCTFTCTNCPVEERSDCVKIEHYVAGSFGNSVYSSADNKSQPVMCINFDNNENSSQNLLKAINYLIKLLKKK